MLGIVESPTLGEPPAACYDRPAHEARGPDVAEDAALVANPVGQNRLLEQLVELAAMLLRDPLAHGLDRIGAVLLHPLARPDSDADGPQQRIRQLECVAARNVEPVEQAIPDEVEIGSQRATRVAVECAQRVEDLS